jgi:hypothetical protein
VVPGIPHHNEGRKPLRGRSSLPEPQRMRAVRKSPPMISKTSVGNAALRKLLAITLLALAGLPLIQPLLALAPKSEANLPACCRRDGKHHCMMSMADRGQFASRTPQFQSPAEKCPYCPVSIAIVQGNALLLPITKAIFAELIAHPAIAAQTELKLRISLNRSRQKRGPPSSSSL